MTEKLHVKELNTLLKLEPELGTRDERTLSVYMPVRAEGFDVRHYDVILEHTAGPYRRKLDDEQKKVLDSELPRFRTQLHLMRPAGCPAIASFSNEAISLMHFIRLPESVDARIEVGPPMLTTLELMLRRYPPALLAVVDKEHGARQPEAGGRVDRGRGQARRLHAPLRRRTRRGARGPHSSSAQSDRLAGVGHHLGFAGHSRRQAARRRARPDDDGQPVERRQRVRSATIVRTRPSISSRIRLTVSRSFPAGSSSSQSS